MKQDIITKQEATDIIDNIEFAYKDLNILVIYLVCDKRSSVPKLYSYIESQNKRPEIKIGKTSIVIADIELTVQESTAAELLKAMNERPNYLLNYKYWVNDTDEPTPSYPNEVGHWAQVSAL